MALPCLNPPRGKSPDALQNVTQEGREILGHGAPLPVGAGVRNQRQRSGDASCSAGTSVRWQGWQPLCPPRPPGLLANFVRAKKFPWQNRQKKRAALEDEGEKATRGIFNPAPCRLRLLYPRALSQQDLPRGLGGQRRRGGRRNAHHPQAGRRAR